MKENGSRLLDNKKIKNRIVFYTMLLVLFVIVNIVVSFAYLRGRANYNESVSTIAIEGVGNIKVVYSGNTSNIEAHDILPGYEKEKKFTVTSNISSGGTLYKRGIWYQIKLIVDTNEFLSGSLVYSLSLDNNSSTNGITALPVDKISIPNGANSDGILVGTGYFSSDNVSHIYNLKLNYVNLEDVDQSDDYQKKFAAHVILTNPQLIDLTFDLDGGNFTNLNLNVNSSIKVPASSSINLPTPTKDGYSFMGWEVVGDASGNGNVITTNLNNILLKASWKIKPYEFDYTGGEQEFIAQYAGYYKLEAWGAQGGSVDNSNIGGYGGYSSGVIRFDVNQNLFINVGGSGINSTSNTAGYLNGGYNGGGRLYTISSSCNNKAGSGGGATHMAFVQGLLPSINSQNLLIVSSGGGGALTRYCGSGDQVYATGGSGGGYIGNSSIMNINTWAYSLSTGGSQGSGGVSGTTNGEGGTANGSFGQGGSSSRTGGYTNSSGGGGGYYGGAGGIFVGGGGGSGYIGNSLLTDKYMYCYNCSTSDVESTKTYSTTCAEETPTENCAKKGNGYARITYLHS